VLFVVLSSSSSIAVNNNGFLLDRKREVRHQDSRGLLLLFADAHWPKPQKKMRIKKEQDQAK
jgi:hypothetical protein